MKVTNISELSTRYTALEADVQNVFNTHNSLLDAHFEKISYLSSILPNYLSQITTLADMVTDAIVVSGRSRLSKLCSELAVVSSKGIKYKPEVNSLELATVAESTYAIKGKTSHILTNTDYAIFNTDKTAISSLEQLLHRGESILLETSQGNSKYTLVLDLDIISKINTVSLTLGLTTSSYPLISEIYYVENNKKVNCFILNSLSNKFDMDLNRTLNNVYELSILPIEAKRLYITLEDVGKPGLILSNISIKKVKHEAAGSIVFGPIISTSAILKTSIESSGNTDGARYYVSTDLSTWREILTPQQVDFVTGRSKILSFNTVNSNSLQLAEDVKKLYLKIDLKAIPVDGLTSEVLVLKDNFIANTKTISGALTVGNVAVYKDMSNVVHGLSKREVNLNAFRILDKNITKLLYNNTYKLKGFVDSSESYSAISTDTLQECLVDASPLKRGGETIALDSIEPKSTTLYGYAVINNTVKEFNRDTTKNLVLKLKDTYNRDTYSLKQGQREILIDLSLGYIESCIDVMFVVEGNKPVTLHNSIGTKVMDLIVGILPDSEISYVSLLANDMFQLPVSTALVLNPLYPIVLNTEQNFSLLSGELKASDKLIRLANTTTITKEPIPTTIKVSKENSSLLVVKDVTILDKYLLREVKIIPAFSKSRAVKLKNRDIKRGSLSIERADKPYLVEVSYINGVDEFKTYATTSVTAAISTQEDFITTFNMVLEDQVDDFESLQVSIKGKYEVPVYFRRIDGGGERDLEFYVGTSDYFLDGDILEISYLSLRENPTNLYSVNYGEGVVYLSASMNSDLTIAYSFYNTFLTGLKALQLESEDYSYDSNVISIINEETNTSYIAVYEVITELTPPTTTPFITNTKINYINTRDEESLP